MLELTEVQCRSLELSRMFLTWEATGTEDPLDYDIYVERADSPGGAWTTLTSVPLVDSSSQVRRSARTQRRRPDTPSNP